MLPVIDITKKIILTITKKDANITLKVIAITKSTKGIIRWLILQFKLNLQAIKLKR